MCIYDLLPLPLHGSKATNIAQAVPFLQIRLSGTKSGCEQREQERVKSA